MEYRAKVDARLRQLEGGRVHKLSKQGVSVGPSAYELNTPVKVCDGPPTCAFGRQNKALPLLPCIG